MKKAIILVSIIFLITKGNLHAQETLNIGVIDFPPFYVVENDKEPSGFLLDYLKAVTEKAGYAHRVYGYPTKRLIMNLGSGEIQLTAAVKRFDVYRDFVFFSQKKIIDIDIRIYTRLDTPLPASQDELKGKKIMLMAGYSYSGLMEFLIDPANNITLDTSKDHTMMFRKLFAKRGDYLLDYYNPSEFALKSINHPDIQSHSLQKAGVFLVLSKKTPNVYEVMKRLEKACDELAIKDWGLTQ